MQLAFPGDVVLQDNDYYWEESRWLFVLPDGSVRRREVRCLLLNVCHGRLQCLESLRSNEASAKARKRQAKFNCFIGGRR